MEEDTIHCIFIAFYHLCYRAAKHYFYIKSDSYTEMEEKSMFHRHVSLSYTSDSEKLCNTVSCFTNHQVLKIFNAIT